MRRTDSQRILLTGATGYVGSHLLARLETLNLSVRCLTRRADALAGRVGPHTEVVTGDVLDLGRWRMHSTASAPRTTSCIR